jgi:histidine transport system permease protein
METVLAYQGQLLRGTVVTLELALLSLLFAVVLGLIGAFAKLSGNRVAGAIASAYTTLIRGVPELVLMLIVFFGGQQLLNQIGTATGWWRYLEVNQLIAGVCTIGFVYGAYMTETFRGAILAVPRGQVEAAKACGMSGMLTFRRIIWPQMVRYALPGFSNNWLVLIKSTALVSVIGVQDLVYNAFVAGRSTRQLFTFMFAVLVIYLILTAVSDVGLRWIERRYSRGVMKHAS